MAGRWRFGAPAAFLKSFGAQSGFLGKQLAVKAKATVDFPT